ncbi:phage Gp37/Gp68 family protein [Janthinobacterium sp. PC23-8]|uniref:phage Gp37/Gp68 family protein n=1 Tax=Janthinobacterium sp. PC23-8 TaxID=2012679 RepID=UPI000B978B8B|nr:phage Gp37/Gp68 family protein [Janthinobacterium sp. PC23-8]OYO29192.1 hypothetical protein CD932_19045 [Janthinobacterium sp. PC23-8]
MSENSKIEWCDHTFNPWEGCQKVGPGCDHCYAETRNARFAGGMAVNWGPGAPRRRTSAANWKKPLAWSMTNFVECEACGHRGAGVPWRDVGPNMGIIDDGHQCAACGSRNVEPTRARVFCASLADVFDNAVDPQWRFDLMRLIEQTPNLDWLLLTKRIGNAATMLDEAVLAINHGRWNWRDNAFPNVWLGATVVNQAEADRDIPKLLAVPAARRFLSMEPLLGPVNLTAIPMSGSGHHEFDPIITANVLRRAEAYPPLPSLDWVIVGGESGPGARPMHPLWARNLRDQCAAAGVPFLFKQWGEWLPGGHYTTELAIKDSNPGESKYLCALWTGATWNFGRFGPDEIHFEAEPMYLVGKKASGRELYGRTHDEFPEAV